MKRLVMVSILGALVAVSGSAATARPKPVATPEAPLRMAFAPHAAIFSLDTKQAALVDPEVFVAAANAQPATGFEQIAHLANVRNATMTDDGTQFARDANGRTLGVDLTHWFSATGLIAFSPAPAAGAGVPVSARFAGLVPRGRYSLFESDAARGPHAAGPLDGTGLANSFTAASDGSADISLTAPKRLPHGAIVVLVFHSDARDHGLQTGALGIDAEQQMALRMP